MNTINDLITVLNEIAEICVQSNKEINEAGKEERKAIANKYLVKAKELETKLSSLRLSAKDSEHIRLLRETAKKLTKLFDNISKGRNTLAYANGVMMRKKIAEYRRRKRI